MGSMRHSRSRTTSSSSQSRPPTASSDPGSEAFQDAFQDAFEDQNSGQINREFDHLRHLLSLVGSSTHQPGGMAQWAFPRAFRANVSQRRVVEELEILRILVMKGMDSASQASSSRAGSRPVTPRAPTSPRATEAADTSLPLHLAVLGSIELDKRRSGAWENLAGDSDLLTLVAEEKDDQVARRLREENEQLLGTAKETQENLGEARSQIQRLDALLRQNELEVESFKTILAEREGQIRDIELKAEEQSKMYERRLDETEKRHDDAVQGITSTLRELRKNYDTLVSAKRSAIEDRDDRIARLIEQQNCDTQEHQSVLASKLAQKDSDLNVQRNRYERELQDLRATHEQALETEKERWRNEIAGHQARHEFMGREILQRDQRIQQLEEMRYEHERSLECLGKSQIEEFEEQTVQATTPNQAANHKLKDAECSSQERTNDMHQQLSDRAQALEKLEQQHRGCETKMHDTATKHQQTLDSARATHEERLQSLWIEHHQDLRDQATRASSDMAAVAKHLDDTKHANQQGIEALERQLLQSKNQFETLKNELNKTMETIHKDTQCAQDVTASKHAHESEEAKAEYERLHAEAEDRHESVTTSLQNEINQHHVEAQTSEVSHTRRVSALGQKLHDQGTTHEREMSEIQHAHDEMFKLQPAGHLAELESVKSMRNKEIEDGKKKHAETHDIAESVRLRGLENAESLKEQHRRGLITLEAQNEEIKRKPEEAVNDMAAHHQSTLDTLRANRDAEMNTVRSSHEEGLAKLQAKYADALALAEQWRTEVEDTRTRLHDVLEQEKRNHLQTAQTHEQRLSEMETSHAAQAAIEPDQRLDGLRSQHTHGIDVLRCDQVTTLEDARMSKEALLQELHETHATELATAKHEGLNTLTSVQQEHTEAIDQLTKEHQTQMEIIRGGHAQNLEDLNLHFKTKLEQKQAEHEAHKTKLQERLDEIRHDHETAMDDLKREHERQVSQLQQQLESHPPEIGPTERAHIIEQEHKTWERDMEVKHSEGSQRAEEGYREMLAQQELELTRRMEAGHKAVLGQTVQELENLRISLGGLENAKLLVDKNNVPLRQRLATASTKLYEAEGVCDALLERSSSCREPANGAVNGSRTVSRGHSCGPSQEMAHSRWSPSSAIFGETNEAPHSEVDSDMKSKLEATQQSNVELTRLNNELRSKLRAAHSHNAQNIAISSAGRLSLDQERPSFWPQEDALQVAKERLFGEYRRRLEAMVREEVAREPLKPNIQDAVASATRELNGVHKKSMADLRKRISHGELHDAPDPVPVEHLKLRNGEPGVGLQPLQSERATGVPIPKNRVYVNMSDHATNQIFAQDLSIPPDHFEDVLTFFPGQERAHIMDAQRAYQRPAHHHKAVSTGLESKYNPLSLSPSRLGPTTRNRFGRLASPLESKVTAEAEKPDMDVQISRESRSRQTNDVVNATPVARSCGNKPLLRLRKGSKERAAERYGGASPDPRRPVQHQNKPAESTKYAGHVEGRQSGVPYSVADGDASGTPITSDTGKHSERPLGKRPKGLTLAERQSSAMSVMSRRRRNGCL